MVDKANKTTAKVKKTNLAFKIAPEFTKSWAKFGISGSLIVFNQMFEKKNAPDNPNNTKRLNSNKYENNWFWFLILMKLLLIRIAAAGVAGSQ